MCPSSRTNNVVHLTQFLGLGGLERLILNLTAGLKKHCGYSPSVFVYDNLPNQEKTLVSLFEKEGIRVHQDVKAAGFSFKSVKKILRFCRDRNARILHSHDMSALVYAIFVKFFSFGQIKVVHTQHSFIHIERYPRYIWFERFFTLFVDALTTVSDDTTSIYRKIGVSKKIVTIPNGVEFISAVPVSAGEKRELRQKLFETAEGLKIESPLLNQMHRVWVVYLARVHPKKGQEHAIAAWGKLSPELRKKASLIYVGQETFQGQLEKLQCEIENFHASVRDEERSIHYFGFTLFPRDWLKACDVFITLSEFEGMPLGPIEAVGSGIEVVASSIKGHEILKEHSLQCDFADANLCAHALSETINGLTLGSIEKRVIAFEARRVWRKEYGIEGMAKKYSEIYLSVMN